MLGLSRTRFVLTFTVLLGGCPGGSPPEVTSDGASSGTTGRGDSTGTTGVLDTSGVDTAVPDGTSASTGSGNGQDCCSVHAQEGCDDPSIATCVCDQEAFCCAFSWDADCVALAEQCGGCGAATTNDPSTGSTGPDPTGGGGDCCMAIGMVGCSDQTIEDCVCAFDDYCCVEEWDGQCVDEAQAKCGADCGMPPPPPPSGDCCMPQPGPGCDDMAIETCVCAIDPFCCDMQWDDICVGEANNDCMGECYPPGMGDCCVANGSPGCQEPDVQNCVCAFDGYCCTTEWDGQCVDEANNDCGGCMGGGGGTGGSSGGSDSGGMSSGDCCFANGGPGCEDPVVEACVCASLPSCCNVEWSAPCVDEATIACAATCP